MHVKKLIIQGVFCSSLFLCFGWLNAQVPGAKDWHLVKQKNGIEVFTAPGGHDGLKQIKVMAEMSGSLQRVKEIFSNIPLQESWVFATRKSYLVKKPDENSMLYYNETGLPWPASNRDVVIRMVIEKDASHKSVQIRQEAEPGTLPVHKGLVRVQHLFGLWDFTENGNNKLKAVYFLDVDPGGSLPAWIVNLFMAKGPYETFVKLQQLLNR
jgi:DNA repair exonuclease SbcCD nuclease subunit